MWLIRAQFSNDGAAGSATLDQRPFQPNKRLWMPSRDAGADCPTECSKDPFHQRGRRCGWPAEARKRGESSPAQQLRLLAGRGLVRLRAWWVKPEGWRGCAAKVPARNALATNTNTHANHHARCRMHRMHASCKFRCQSIIALRSNQKRPYLFGCLLEHNIQPLLKQLQPKRGPETGSLANFQSFSHSP